MALALCLLSLLAPSPELHVDDRRGFEIEVPERWNRFEQESAAEGYSLILLPPGSLGEEGVTLIVRELGPDEGLADVLARARTRAEELGATRVEEGEGELAGEPCPELDVRLDSPAGALRVRVSHLVRGGLSYAVQRSARAEEFEETVGELEEVVGTLRFHAPSEVEDDGATRAASLERLAATLGSRVRWARDWERASARAEAEGRPVLVAAFLYSGFELGETPRATAFADDAVVELVEERFVPLELGPGDDTTFLADYGLSDTAFGQALMVVSPQGRVLLETHHASSPHLAYAFLRAALERFPEYVGTPVPEAAGPLDRAAMHVARGELDEALALLERPGSAEGWALRAKALARLRRGREALVALERALAAGGERADLRLDQVELHVRLGERAEARALLERHLPGADGADTRARGLFLSGLLHLAEGSAADAQAHWRGAVREAPDSRWAARAAGALRGARDERGLRPGLTWPGERVVEELLAFPEPPAGRPADPRGDGVAWLLERQLSDGSWGHFAGGVRAPGLGPDPIADSITALAVRALLAHRGVEGAEWAAKRGVLQLRESVLARGDGPSEALATDYTTWSDAMMLEALGDAVEAGVVEVGELRGTAGTLVRDLVARRAEGGGWSFYVAGRFDAEGALPPHCMSFTTAACVRALRRARQVGFTVPRSALEPGLELLEEMRSPEGVFPYFHFDDASARRAPAEIAGEVGRGPTCELALFVNGRSDAERLKRSVELFLEHAPSYAAERGKVLMHAGPEGQGSHYLLFDLAHAALAAAELPEERALRSELRDLVLATRQPDGAFVDTPVLGRAYGTAMALLALAKLDA